MLKNFTNTDHLLRKHLSYFMNEKYNCWNFRFLFWEEYKYKLKSCVKIDLVSIVWKYCKNFLECWCKMKNTLNSTGSLASFGYGTFGYLSLFGILPVAMLEIFFNNCLRLFCLVLYFSLRSDNILCRVESNWWDNLGYNLRRDFLVELIRVVYLSVEMLSIV